MGAFVLWTVAVAAHPLNGRAAAGVTEPATRATQPATRAAGLSPQTTPLLDTASRWNRAQLVEALEHMIRSGEPRHITHDEGQELDAQIRQALASGVDPELQWLLTRAAAPIVPEILRPLSSRARPSRIVIHTGRVLTLPWPVDYLAAIDARVDGGPWQALASVKARASDGPFVDAALPRAGMTPGFHTLSFRARIRYTNAPPGSPRRETRDLQPVQYGIWGAARTATDPVRPLFDAAASVSAAQLDPALPDVPFSRWIADLPHDATGRPPALDWRTAWCAQHEALLEDWPVSGDTCVVARRSGPNHAFTEIWIKTGALRREGDESRWVRVPPALTAAYLHEGLSRVRVPLASLPFQLAQPSEAWPAARLVVNAAGISVSPSTITPGVPATLRVLVANMGDADAPGITIHVDADSDLNLPALHRSFVRTIRAGGSVEIETPVTFPARYGIVSVLLVADHAELQPRIDAANENHAAFAVINERAAPAALLQRACIAIGKPAAACPR